MVRPSSRSDLVLLALALVAGALFTLSLPRLWPLARIDLTADRGALEAAAREGLEEAGLGTELERGGHRAASRLTVNAAALDYLQRSFGRERAQELIAAGLPVYPGNFTIPSDPPRKCPIWPGGGRLRPRRRLQGVQNRLARVGMGGERRY